MLLHAVARGARPRASVCTLSGVSDTQRKLCLKSVIKIAVVSLRVAIQENTQAVKSSATLMSAVSFLQVLLSARQRVRGLVLLLQEDEVPSRLRAFRHSTVTVPVSRQQLLASLIVHIRISSTIAYAYIYSIGYIAGSTSSLE